MATTPKISVLMPVYNGSAFIDQTIECLLNQTFADFEVVTVDDGSQDDSYAILQKWENRDPRIKVYQNSQNMGVFETQKRLATLATGEFLAQQDQDDYSAPERLQVQIQLLEANPEAPGTVSNVWLVDETGHPIGTTAIPDTASEIRAAMRKANVCWHSTLMMRRSAFERVGGYRKEADHVADYDLMLRLLQIGDLIPSTLPLATYGLSPGTVTYKDRATQEALAQNIRHTYFGTPKPSVLKFTPLEAKEARQLYHREVGRMYLAKGDTRRARQNLKNLLRMDPSLSDRFFLGLSYIPPQVLKLAKRLTRRGSAREEPEYFLAKRSPDPATPPPTQ